AIELTFCELTPELGLLLLQRFDALRQRRQLLRVLMTHALLTNRTSRPRTLRSRRQSTRLRRARAYDAGPLLVAAWVFDPATIAVERDHLRDHVVEECTIVAYQEHRAGIILQQVFQQL